MPTKTVILSSAMVLCCVLVDPVNSGKLSIFQQQAMFTSTTKSPYSLGESVAKQTTHLPVPYPTTTTSSKCKEGYVGYPPNCQLRPELWSLCFENNECNPDGKCDYETLAPCTCASGFVGFPPYCKAGPALLALCDPYPCGANSDCHMQDGRPVCKCLRDYQGTPPNCTPSKDMWRVCYKDLPCGKNAKCTKVNGKAVCSECHAGYSGTPPSCAPPKGCHGVENACGPNAECRDEMFFLCACASGFVGTPPDCKAGPALLALCDPYPCGANSDCHMQDGRPVCKCARDYQGTPPNCTPSKDMWRVCYKDKPCGLNAKCEMVDGKAVCSTCDFGYSSQPPYCYMMSNEGK